jgi:ABC-2 type transport system ATP-binding protein
MTIPAISATGLRKSYGDKVVLAGIDLDVPSGTVFSLLGPNGAGKTTTVNILSTLISPDAGTASVAGHDLATDPEGIRSAIGLTGQFSAVDSLLTGEENLFLMADLNHLPRRAGRRRAAELLERFDLTDAAKKVPSTFSGGMRRKLDLAMTLVGDPKVIFLDEPTTGLDPRSRRIMWDIIRDLVASGVTILLTTQYLEEADQLADRVAVLDGGRIVAQGTPDELKRRVPGGHLRLRFPDAISLQRAGIALQLSTSDGRGDDETLALRVPTDGTVTALRGVLDRLDAEAVPVDSLTVHTPDLDDVFLSLTGHRTGTTKELAR